MATFYAARSEIITPLPWLTFALPFSQDECAQRAIQNQLLDMMIHTDTLRSNLQELTA